jgi:hypothetical protein
LITSAGGVLHTRRFFYYQKVGFFIIKNILRIKENKREWKPPSKIKEKGGKNSTGLSPRNMKACHSISIALLQSVAKVGTQSIMHEEHQKYVA